MLLQLQNFSTLLQNMSASVQGSAAQLIDLSVGGVLRALLEASASIALWMQWLILQVLSMTRAATSVGPDLDSWMADFSLTRLPGARSAGSVTFARYTVGVAATIPVGTTVLTSDGTQSFAVLADATNPAWNASSGYLLAAAVASVTVPAQATVPGVAGNIQAGTIGLLGTAITGVDTVSNAQAFGGGTDPETDAALRARFTLYINSRSLATPGAVAFALATLQPGLRTTILENVDLTGESVPGNFCVVVDDGTGYPPASLIANASAAVESVRPIGSTYAVSGPAILSVAVQMTILTSNPQTAQTVASAIQANILAWIAGLPIAGTLAVSKLEAIAHATDPSVVSVVQTSINGGTADVTAAANAVILAASVTVS
jgi:uncharacterized phage protein gp47/JayE